MNKFISDSIDDTHFVLALHYFSFIIPPFLIVTRVARWSLFLMSLLAKWEILVLPFALVPELCSKRVMPRKQAKENTHKNNANKCINSQISSISYELEFFFVWIPLVFRYIHLNIGVITKFALLGYILKCLLSKTTDYSGQKSDKQIIHYQSFSIILLVI